MNSRGCADGMIRRSSDGYGASPVHVVFPVLAVCVAILAPPSASIRHFIMTNYGKTAVIHASRYNVIITRH